MEQEIFRNALAELAGMAQSAGGMLTKSQVDAQFAGQLSDDQLQLVYQYLERSGIMVEGWSQNLQERLSGRRVLDAQQLWSAEEAPQQLEEDEEAAITALECYLEEIGALTDPGTEAKALLLQQLLEGDAGAMQKLAESFLPMVADLVSEYEKDSVLPVEDLLQEGNIALWEALGSLEEAESVAALTAMLMNAVNTRLEEAIQSELDENDSDQAMAGQVSRLSDTLKMLEEELGHPASIEELSAFLEMDTDKIRDILSLAGDQIGKA